MGLPANDAAFDMLHEKATAPELALIMLVQSMVNDELEEERRKVTEQAARNKKDNEWFVYLTKKIEGWTKELLPHEQQRFFHNLKHWREQFDKEYTP